MKRRGVSGETPQPAMTLKWQIPVSVFFTKSIAKANIIFMNEKMLIFF